MEDKKYVKGIFYLLFCIFLVVLVAILKITSSVTIPIMLSVFLSLVVLPVITKLKNKLHIPWSVSIFLSLILIAIVISVAGSLLIKSVQSIVNLYPRYENRFITVYQFIADKYQLTYDDGKGLIENLWNQLGIRNAVQNFALAFSNHAAIFLKNLFTVLLLYVFLIAEISLFQKKIAVAFEGNFRHRVRHIAVNVVAEISQYLFIKFIFSLATGIIVYFGLKIIGVEFAIIWGFLAFVLNFIPTFGSWISCCTTILFSILQFFPSWPPMLFTALLMILTNFILGNVLEPRIEGDNLNLSPFVIIVSLSLWGWLWGFIGMILAVPFTVIIKIVCENVSYLKPVAIFLGSRKILPSKKA